MCVGALRPEIGVGFSRSGVMGSCELPGLCAEN